MLNIIDQYILRRYLLTLTGMILLFIPIGIMASLAEKIGKIIDNEAPLEEVIEYYGNFTLVIGNLLLPVFLFLSIIFFTSRMASKTEIVAILSSGVSYWRFLRPYMIGAALVAVLIFFMGQFIVPRASVGYSQFEYNYFHTGRADRQTTNIFNQLSENDYIYVSRLDPNRQIGYNFTYEHFDENKELEYKLTAATIRWVEKDSLYQLTTYAKRTLKDGEEFVQTQRRLDTVFSFEINDLTQVSYVADTKNLFELNSFIEDQRRRGASNINTYILVKYKRWAMPIAAFILTITAVAVSSVKRRGGMGVNLAFGIGVAFIYIFFDKVFGTLAEQAGFNPLLAVVLPNVLFGILGYFMLMKAKR